MDQFILSFLEMKEMLRHRRSSKMISSLFIFLFCFPSNFWVKHFRTSRRSVHWQGNCWSGCRVFDHLTEFVMTLSSAVEKHATWWFEVGAAKEMARHASRSQNDSFSDQNVHFCRVIQKQQCWLAAAAAVKNKICAKKLAVAPANFWTRILIWTAHQFFVVLQFLLCDVFFVVFVHLCVWCVQFFCVLCILHVAMHVCLCSGWCMQITLPFWQDS